MNQKFIRKQLSYLLAYKYVSVEEYQDKYYFRKQIQELFPGLTDKLIYDAINFANRVTRFPRKKTDFIDVLSTRIFYLYFNLNDG